MHHLIRLDPQFLETSNAKCANDSVYAQNRSFGLRVIVDNDKLRDEPSPNSPQNFKDRKWRLNDDPVTRA